MSGATRLRDLRAYPDFLRYALGRFTATIAWQMLGVVAGWWIYRLTADPLDLGYVGLAQFLPFLLLVLPAGQIADRIDRRLVLVIAYVAEVVAVLGLLMISLRHEPATWTIFLALAVFGAGRALWMPAGQAMTVNLVPPEVFPRAVGFNSTLFQAAVIAGPAVGGLALAFGDRYAGGRGVQITLCIILALLVVVVWLMASIRARQKVQARGEWRVSDVFDGLRFVFEKKTVLGAITLDLFAVLLGGAVALLPIYAKDILHVGPMGFGVLRAAPGVGAMITAAWLAMRPLSRHVGRYLFGGVGLFALATVLFGLSTSFWWSLVLLVLMGAGDMVSVFVRHMLVQLETPNEIRGRVSAVSALFIGASNELGEFESGLTAKWWGTVPAVVIGGLACGAAVLVCMAAFPVLRRLDRFPQPAQSLRN